MGTQASLPWVSGLRRRSRVALALAAPVPACLGSREPLRPYLSRASKRLPSLLQDLGIRYRPALTWRSGGERFGNRARRAAPAAPARTSQPIQSVANLPELRTQLVILSGELPILSLEALVSGHDLGDLVDNRTPNC
jgi:hypothetical protein